MNGHVRIVQASILGSILVNLLPILGSALIAADTTGGDDSLRSTETQILACLLFVSVFVFMIPVGLLPSNFAPHHRLTQTSRLHSTSHSMTPTASMTWSST